MTLLFNHTFALSRVKRPRDTQVVSTATTKLGEQSVALGSAIGQKFIEERTK